MYVCICPVWLSIYTQQYIMCSLYAICVFVYTYRQMYIYIYVHILVCIYLITYKHISSSSKFITIIKHYTSTIVVIAKIRYNAKLDVDGRTMKW